MILPLALSFLGGMAGEHALEKAEERKSALKEKERSAAAWRKTMLESDDPTFLEHPETITRSQQYGLDQDRKGAMIQALLKNQAKLKMAEAVQQDPPLDPHLLGYRDVDPAIIEKYFPPTLYSLLGGAAPQAAPASQPTATPPFSQQFEARQASYDQQTQAADERMISSVGTGQTAAVAAQRPTGEAAYAPPPVPPAPAPAVQAPPRPPKGKVTTHISSEGKTSLSLEPAASPTDQYTANLLKWGTAQGLSPSAVSDFARDQGIVINEKMVEEAVESRADKTFIKSLEPLAPHNQAIASVVNGETVPMDHPAWNSPTKAALAQAAIGAIKDAGRYIPKYGKYLDISQKESQDALVMAAMPTLKKSFEMQLFSSIRDKKALPAGYIDTWLQQEMQRNGWTFDLEHSDALKQMIVQGAYPTFFTANQGKYPGDPQRATFETWVELARLGGPGSLPAAGQQALTSFKTYPEGVQDALRTRPGLNPENPQDMQRAMDLAAAADIGKRADPEAGANALAAQGTLPRTPGGQAAAIRGGYATKRAEEATSAVSTAGRKEVVTTKARVNTERELGLDLNDPVVKDMSAMRAMLGQAQRVHELMTTVIDERGHLPTGLLKGSLNTDVLQKMDIFVENETNQGKRIQASTLKRFAESIIPSSAKLSKSEIRFLLAAAELKSEKVRLLAGLSQTAPELANAVRTLPDISDAGKAYQIKLPEAYRNMRRSLVTEIEGFQKLNKRVPFTAEELPTIEDEMTVQGVENGVMRIR